MAETAHSKNFEKVKRFYSMAIWGKIRVANAVTHPASKPWITAAEYEEITGETYTSTAEE